MLQRQEAIRSQDHNARFHAMVRDIAKQVTWAGQRWDEEQWKRILLGAKFGQAVVPDPLGGGYPVVVNKRRSRSLTNADMEEMLGELSLRSLA